MSALKISPQSKAALDAGFAAQFGGLPQRYFSAPGRTEISGNHTDHQHGCVLAGAVDLETVADVTLNGTDMICVQSQGYAPVEIDLKDLSIHENEKNTTAALVRSVVSRST